MKSVESELTAAEARKFIDEVPAKKYKWKSEGEQGATHIGVIAQDVAEAGFFGMLSTYDDPTIEAQEYRGVMQPEGKRLMMDYNQIGPVLMTLVKDLYKELDDAKARIAALEAK